MTEVRRVCCLGMSGAFAACGQTADEHLPTQRVQHAQHFFKSHGGFTGFQLDDKPNANPGGQGQLGLGQAQLVAGGADRLAQRVGGVNGCGQGCFLFGKL